MDLFVYKLSLSSKYHDFANWDQAVQDVLKYHAAYLQEGVDKGTIVMVGRTDTELKDNFGITIFKASDIETAAQFMNADPAVQNGLMTAEVFPFKMLMVTDEAKGWNVW